MSRVSVKYETPFFSENEDSPLPIIGGTNNTVQYYMNFYTFIKS